MPVGTGDEVERILREVKPDARAWVVSNPEFLREGAAIEDFKRPDRIVVGTDNEDAAEILREVYRPLYLNKAPLLFTSRRTAELIKYAANAFLATKITFINEIADLCEIVGADVQDVSRGIGLDNRIGPKFLHAGPGYGGSCFPKDTLALLKTAEDHGAPLRIVESVAKVNEARKRAMGRKVIQALGGEARGKTVALLGLTFKPNTDDMRDAPSLVLIEELLARGAQVCAYDPEAMEAARRIVGDRIEYAKSHYAACQGADALLIATEWSVFREPDFALLRAALKAALIFDGRNVYSLLTMWSEGFTYHSIGRPPVQEALLPEAPLLAPAVPTEGRNTAELFGSATHQVPEPSVA